MFFECKYCWSANTLSLSVSSRARDGHDLHLAGGGARRRRRPHSARAARAAARAPLQEDERHVRGYAYSIADATSVES